MVRVIWVAPDTFDALDERLIQSDGTVCEQLTVDEYVDIATDDQCKEIVSDMGLVRPCNDRQLVRGCATTQTAALLVSLAALFVRRRRRISR